jgi:hypothetical protein
MMILKELKDFLNSIPEQFDNYGVVNGEVGILKGEDGKEDLVYRCDKPIITLYVDEHSQEVCFFHQTQDEVTEISGDVIFGKDKEDNK